MGVADGMAPIFSVVIMKVVLSDTAGACVYKGVWAVEELQACRSKFFPRLWHCKDL